MIGLDVSCERPADLETSELEYYRIRRTQWLRLRRVAIDHTRSA